MEGGNSGAGFMQGRLELLLFKQNLKKGRLLDPFLRQLVGSATSRISRGLDHRRLVGALLSRVLGIAFLASSPVCWGVVASSGARVDRRPSRFSRSLISTSVSENTICGIKSEIKKKRMGLSYSPLPPPSSLLH